MTHLNTSLLAISVRGCEYSGKDFYNLLYINNKSVKSQSVEKSKNVTVNSITNNRKGSYAESCKALKERDLKESEMKDRLTQNIQK